MHHIVLVLLHSSNLHHEVCGPEGEGHVEGGIYIF